MSYELMEMKNETKKNYLPNDVNIDFPKRTPYWTSFKGQQMVNIYVKFHQTSQRKWMMGFTGEGGTQYIRSYGYVPPTWVAKSASWFE